jgi:hypothetical protein
MKTPQSIIDFGNALTRLIWGIIRYASITDGIIKSVDEEKCTCEVLCNKTTYTGVPLRVLISSKSSVLEIPKVNTNCLLTFRDINNSRPQLFQVHECEKLLYKVGNTTMDITSDGIIMNGGNNGGLPILEKINDNLNALKAYSEAINTALPAAFTAIGAGPSANGASGASSFQGAMAGMTINLSDMENTKIKQ